MKNNKAIETGFLAAAGILMIGLTGGEIPVPENERGLPGSSIGRVTIQGETVETPVRELEERIVVPRDATFTLIYEPPVSLQGVRQDVRWEGAETTAQERGVYSARLDVPRAGDYSVALTVHVPADPRSGRRDRTYRTEYRIVALDVPASDVRTRILYPSAHGTPPLDLNGDFRVNDADLQRFWEGYGHSAGEAEFSALTDWDGNGRAELRDLVQFVDALEGWSGKEAPDYGSGDVLPVAARVYSEQYSFVTPSPILVAETVPPGLEGWIEWSLDGAMAGDGRVLSREILDTGTHVFSVRGLGPGIQDSRDVTIYSVEIVNETWGRKLASGKDILRDGVEYRLRAITTPPGFEDYVNWYATTSFGTAYPSRGRGATFQVLFDATWGFDGFQWLGVQADDRFFNQDQKAPEGFTDQVGTNAQILVSTSPGDPEGNNGFLVQLASPSGIRTRIGREPPAYQTGQNIATELEVMVLTGEHPSLGHVIVRLHSANPSLGAITNVVANGGNLQSGLAFFDVFVEVELPQLGLLLNTQGNPVRVESPIIELPPYGSVFSDPVSAPSVPLFNTFTSELFGWIVNVSHVICDCPDTADEANWNNAQSQGSNNCYNYATNQRNDQGKAQPGAAAGQQYTSFKCADVEAAALLDGVCVPPGGANPPAGQFPVCPPDKCLIALVADTTGSIQDYHWYRKNDDGSWSHKPGLGKASTKDGAGAGITDPRTANRNTTIPGLNYTVFCGFYCTPWDITVAVSKPGTGIEPLASSHLLRVDVLNRSGAGDPGWDVISQAEADAIDAYLQGIPPVGDPGWEGALGYQGMGVTRGTASGFPQFVRAWSGTIEIVNGSTVAYYTDVNGLEAYLQQEAIDHGLCQELPGAPCP